MSALGITTRAITNLASDDNDTKIPMYQPTSHSDSQEEITPTITDTPVMESSEDISVPMYQPTSHSDGQDDTNNAPSSINLFRDQSDIDLWRNQIKEEDRAAGPEVITETDRLLRDMSEDDQIAIQNLVRKERERHSELLRRDPFSEKRGSIARRKAVIEEIKERGDVFANQVFSDDPLLDTQKENRKHAIKYVDNMMERYGITRDEAFLKILESKTAKNHPNSPLVLYALGVSTEEAADRAALEAANINFGSEAVDAARAKTVENLNSPNLATRHFTRRMFNAGVNLRGMNFIAEVDSILNPVTWVLNTPDNFFKMQKNISKRDSYEVTKEEYDELLTVDSVEITKEDYDKIMKERPELRDQLLTEDVIVEGGEVETKYYKAPYKPYLKYDADKKGYYYKSQEFEALPLAGNTAMLILDAWPAGKLLSIGKKKFTLKQETVNKYSKQSVARQNLLAQRLKTQENNKKIADTNWEDRQRLIEEFEERQSILQGRPVVIHTVVDGKKVLDPEKTRIEGKALAEATHNKTIITKVTEHIKLKELDMTLDDLVVPVDETMLPHVVPKNLDALTAVLKKLQNKNPEYFKKADEVMPNGRKKSLIDQMFEYALDGDIEQTDDLINVLADYGMSIDEFVLMTLGNVSEAGTILGKFAQVIGRKKGLMQREAEIDNKVFEAGFKKFWQNWFVRGENIVRGALVTPWATAMRNLSSAGIRATPEVLINVLEEVVYEFYKTTQASAGDFGIAPFKGLYEAGKKLNPLQGNSAWTNSFGDITSTLNAAETKRTMDFLLEHPQLEHLDSTLFGAVGELRKSMGRGQHTNPIANAADIIYTKAEDAVEYLNGPNRLQEFMVRRGVFLAQLRRKLKNEWGLDLEEEILEKGNLDRILMDASVAADNVSTIRPDGARSIHAILEDATYRALEVTYAKQPDFFFFRDIARFITKTGLTAIPGLTFPRFMFNGIELMGRNMAGAGLPILKMLTGNVKSSADVRAVGENLVGLSAIYAMYQVIEQKDENGKYIQPEDHNLLNVGADVTDKDGNVLPASMNIQGNFPLAQIKYTAQAMRASMNGTFELFDPDFSKASEVFLGDAFRSGQATNLLKDIRAMAVQADSQENKRQSSEVFGRLIGQMGSRIFAPIFQITDLQRAAELKPLEYKDNLPPIETETTLADSIKRSFFQRFGTVDEYDLTTRVNVYGQRGTKNQRVGLAMKVFSGVSLVLADSEEGNYLMSLGKRKGIDYTSRLKDPRARLYQNQMTQNLLPLHVPIAMMYEKFDNENYDKKNKTYKSKFSKELSGKLAALNYIDKAMRNVINNTMEASKAQAGTLGKAIINYRNIPKSKRRQALVKWYTYNDSDPDFTNFVHVQTLINFSK